MLTVIDLRRNYFTLLFQHENRGGLEVLDRRSDSFVSAPPREGALHLIIGDMVTRLSNGAC